MAIDPLIPEDPGLLASVGRYLGRFSQVPLNILSGDIGGALRQGADILGDTVDAALPGDWIPEFSRPEDEKKVSSMLGISPDDRILAGGVDFVGDTLLNPLTYLTGGASTAVGTAGKAALKLGIPFTKAAVEIPGSAAALQATGDAAKAAYGVIPQSARDAIQNGVVNTKSTLGWLNPAMPEVAAALDAGDAARQSVTKAGMTEVENIFKGVSPEDRQSVFDVLQNIKEQPKLEPFVAPARQYESEAMSFLDDIKAEKAAKEYAAQAGELAQKPFAPITPVESTGFMSVPDQLAEFSRRAAALGKSPEETARLTALAEKYIPYSQRQFAEATGERGILTRPQGIDTETMSPGLYGQRSWQDIADEASSAIGPSAKAIEARKLKNGADVADELNYGGMARGTTLERDLGAVAARRAEQQGKLAGKAAIAKSLLGDEFVSLADDATRGKVTEILDNLKGVDPEGHRLLTTAWNGMEPRGPIMDMLAKANSVFKPAAVYGLVFPRVGGIMKNILSFPAQFGIAGEGTQALAQAAKTPATVYEAMRQGTAKAFGFQMPPGEIGAAADLMEQAFKRAGGRAKNAEDFLIAQGRDDLANAVRLGVSDGFVSREAVENTIRDSGWGRKILNSIGLGDKAKEKVFDLVDAPAEAFQGAEQYARLGSYLDMVKRGRSPEEAAKAVREALFDYSVKTGANRTLRDLIPFAAYQTNAIRQSGKFLAKNPAAAVALGNLSDTDPSAQYPWMSGQTNIPIGTAETGETQYLTGLGLPTESLNSIPNLSGNIQETGQELRSNLLGNAHPLVKTAYSILSGEDPRFGSAYGSYDRLPGNIEGGKLGQVYNQLAGTGLIQPLSTPLNQIGQLIDERTGPGDKALSLLTGTRVVNVDEDRALRQRLQEFLKTNPDVEQFTSFYQNSPDPETQALIKALNDVKRRMKAKREAAAVAD